MGACGTNVTVQSSASVVAILPVFNEVRFLREPEAFPAWGSQIRLSRLTAQVGGTAVPITYAGPQG
jgi:hypothetical protein